MQKSNIVEFPYMKPDIFDDYEREVIVRLVGTKKAEIAKNIVNTVNPFWFENSQYRSIFNICKELIDNTGFIDIYQLAEKVKGNTKFLLDALNKEVCVTANYRYFVNQLKAKYFNQRALECKTFDEWKMLENDYEQWVNVPKLEHISTGAEELLTEYYDNWEKAIRTGYKSLDSVIGSLQGGDFVIFAGATGSGKTMCAINIMLNIAKAGHKCSFYSLEMSKTQLQNRIIARETGINAGGFRTFSLTDEEQKRHLQYSQDEFHKLPIEICTDYKNLTVENIAENEKKSNSEIVFIDYLGLLKSSIQDNQYERITELSTDLKRCAMTVGKPFFVLHQLSRDIKERKDKRPMLSDLRGSGQLEQDADMVLFVYRPAYYFEDADKTELQIIVAKNRHGDSNRIIEFNYLSSQQKIAERGIQRWN